MNKSAKKQQVVEAAWVPRIAFISKPLLSSVRQTSKT